MTAIKIICDRENKTIYGFEIFGHAESGDYGYDIVCASISILAINVQNSIEYFCEDKFEQDFDEETGYMKFMIKGTPSHDASLLMASAYMGFEGIANSYDTFVRIEIKEV